MGAVGRGEEVGSGEQEVGDWVLAGQQCFDSVIGLLVKQNRTVFVGEGDHLGVVADGDFGARTQPFVELLGTQFELKVHLLG